MTGTFHGQGSEARQSGSQEAEKNGQEARNSPIAIQLPHQSRSGKASAQVIFSIMKRGPDGRFVLATSRPTYPTLEAAREGARLAHVATGDTIAIMRGPVRVEKYPQDLIVA
jgi:hypothetical protein